MRIRSSRAVGGGVDGEHGGAGNHCGGGGVHQTERAKGGRGGGRERETKREGERQRDKRGR